MPKMNTTNTNASASQGHQAWHSAGEASQQNRGGSSRGRNFYKGRGGRQRKMPQPNTAPTREQADVKPKYLSKTPSKETNDPLYREAWFSDPGTELSPAAEELHIYPSCEALPVLTDVMYREIVSSKQGFSKRVSQSSFAYYCAALTYSRLLQIYRDNQNETIYEEERFVKQIEDGNYPVPSLLSVYLSGFGNTTVPGGRQLKFSIQRPPPEAVRHAGGMNGWFGVVDEDTHYLYKHYPCLAVYAKRIQHDLGLPAEEDDVPGAVQPNWNLPEGVRCALPRCGLPNENLLGWRRAERLSHEKREFILDAGIQPEIFPSNNTAICFNMALMNSVRTELEVVERINFQPVASVPAGSQGQVVFDTFSRAEANVVEIRQQSVSECLTGSLGPTTFIGGSLCYRSSHKIDRGRKMWSVYTFNHFNDVPPGWVATINTLRDDEPPEINTMRFRTRPFYVLHRIKDFMAKEVNLRP